MNRRDEYIEQYKILHTKKRYGTSSERQLTAPVRNLVSKKNPQSVLDYGCGQSRLYTQITGPDIIDRYDPAIPGIDHIPRDHYDLVLCTDVLEHVPEEEVDNVLRELKSLGDTVYLVISCDLAAEILPNGQNAHCTVKSQTWWGKKLREFWPDSQINTARHNYVSATLE